MASGALSALCCGSALSHQCPNHPSDCTSFTLRGHLYAVRQAVEAQLSEMKAELEEARELRREVDGLGDFSLILDADRTIASLEVLKDARKPLPEPLTVTLTRP